MLMKWITGVNFINILQVPFSSESVFCSLSLVTSWLCHLMQKNIGQKAAHKMLMKSTAGHNFLFSSRRRTA